MDFEIHGDRETAAGLFAEKAKIQAAMRRGVAEAAHYLERQIKGKLSLSSHPPETSTPSSPGSPPSLISGSLRRSIRTRGPRSNGDGWEATVGPSIVYARIQEYGGTIHAKPGKFLVFRLDGVLHRRTQVTLPPRPYVGPATRESRAMISALIRRAVAQAR